MRNDQPTLPDVPLAFVHAPLAEQEYWEARSRAALGQNAGHGKVLRDAARRWDEAGRRLPPACYQRAVRQATIICDRLSSVPRDRRRTSPTVAPS